MKRIDAAGAAALLSGRNDVLIICHKNPDGDTLGSAAALSKALRLAGKRRGVICHNRIPEKFSFMDIPVWNEEFVPGFIVAVDVADEGLFGEKLGRFKGKVNLCIDHHVSNSGYAEYLCLDRRSPAAAQLMLEIIEKMGVVPDRDIADCLYTGIITDTGCFRFSSTTADTHRAATRLFELGADHAGLSEKFFMSKTRRQMELEKFALNNTEYYCDEKIAVLCLTEDVLERIRPLPTDIEGISSMARDFEWVDISILIKAQSGGGWKISVRTSEKVRANAIAIQLGGGGHLRAAGCEMQGDLDFVKDALVKRAEKEL